MLVELTFVNTTKGYQFGHQPPYDPDCETIGELFRQLQREYGRCESKVYLDTPDGPKACGWVFRKDCEYDDSRDKYTREVWVSLIADVIPEQRKPLYLD